MLSVVNLITKSSVKWNVTDIGFLVQNLLKSEAYCTFKGYNLSKTLKLCF